MDFGIKNAEETIKILGNNNCFGYGDYSSAYKPFIIKDKNEKIAIFNASHYEFGILDSEFEKGVANISHPQLIVDIGTYCAKGYIVIIFAHAGIEHIHQPLPEWRNLYKAFIDAGARCVIASHPHIIQGWEVYNNSPIFYSLGNFYFPSKKSMKRNGIEVCV